CDITHLKMRRPLGVPLPQPPPQAAGRALLNVVTEPRAAVLFHTSLCAATATTSTLPTVINSSEPAPVPISAAGAAVALDGDDGRGGAERECGVAIAGLLDFVQDLCLLGHD